MAPEIHKTSHSSIPACSDELQVELKRRQINVTTVPARDCSECKRAVLDP